MHLGQFLTLIKRRGLGLLAPPGARRRRLFAGVNRWVRTRLLHQLQTADGWWLPSASPPLDVYHAKSFNRFLRKYGAAPLTWSATDADNGEWAAARLALGLLQDRPALREQFPQALFQRETGGYCNWLCTNGARELRLSDAAARHLRSAFARRPSRRVWRLFEERPELLAGIPLALTPAGQRHFLRWLLPHAEPLGNLRIEEICWFLVECAEDAYQGLVATFLRTPLWQKCFPHGITAFGQDDLLAWVRRRYRVRDHWLAPVDLSHVYHPVDQLRLLHAARPALQTLAPQAFRDAADSARLVSWVRKETAATATLDACWWDRLEAGLAGGLAQTPGVNVLGLFCYPSGIQEATRCTVRGLQAAGVRTSCRDVPNPLPGEWVDRADYLGLEWFDTTLVHVMPEPLGEALYPATGLARRPDVFRIGIWYWELETAPPEWAVHADGLQEIWAPTRFIGRAIKAITSVPVIPMLPGLHLGDVPCLPRAHFGLPAGRPLFLFMFDMCSIMERKNPLAVIRAFRRAFPLHDPVDLVIKVTRGDWDQGSLRRLTTAAAEAGVHVIDRLMPRAESYALLNTCDGYVSLHRSEGFGLTLSEAMLLGKPVIATGYSGNLDFMTPANSLLVDHTLVPIDPSVPIYGRGSRWADPNIDQAARHMRWVVEHPEAARALGARARQETSRLLSIEAAGQRMRQRLEAIRAARHPLAGAA